MKRRRRRRFAAAAAVAVLAAGAAAALWPRGGGAPPPPAATPPPMSFDPSAVRAEERAAVEVLNGTGRGGLARDVTELLRARGFDVVYYGNAGARGVDASVVYARGADTLAARHVADALGIATVTQREDTTLLVAVSVVLGKDYPRR